MQRVTSILLLVLFVASVAAQTAFKDRFVYDGLLRATYSTHKAKCQEKGLILPTLANFCDGRTPKFTRQELTAITGGALTQGDVWTPIQGEWLQISDSRICQTHTQAAGVPAPWGEDINAINGHTGTGFPGFCVQPPVEKFQRNHEELSAVYKLLTDLEVKLAKQLTASNDQVAQKEAALKSATDTRNSKERDYNTALDALNQAKKAQEGAQAALTTAQNDRSNLIATIQKELALIRKLKEILGAQHCDDLVFEDRCFKVVKADVDFKQALDACNAWGGMPASIENSRQNAFIQSKIQGCSASWIGGSDSLSEGTWKWLDGVAWSYSNWAPGEPNNAGGNENNLEIYDDGRWNDIPASLRGRAHCYVCKKL